MPNPSHLTDPAVGYDQADLVVGLTELGDPALILGYADDRPTNRLALEAYTAGAELELWPYRVPFLDDVRLHVLGPQPELV